MKVLIVYANHEPKSFNAGMKDLAVATLSEAGHEVVVSDLYAMRFKAVADRDDFLTQADSGYFKYQAEQRAAQQGGTLAPDIIEEQRKVYWADFILFQFPLWWFSMPAIMKGWVDRVFTYGFSYGGGKWYERGPLQGRRSMLALTTGQSAASFSADGINGDINQVLYHIHHGMLHFVGLEVLPPFVAWSPARVSAEERERYLAEYRERLLSLDRTPPLRFRSLAVCDGDLKLRSELAHQGRSGL